MTDADPLILLKNSLTCPLGLIDVGARWGVASRWEAVQDAARMLCFDPDEEECARLNQASPPHVTYLPYGLAEQAGEQTLHVTAEPACSSLYPPRREIYENYASLAIIRPVDTMRVACRRLDDAIAEYDFGIVDAIKLDTQGSELPILKGGLTALASASFIEIEVEFNALYEGQPLFHQVDGFMREQGFVLWRFENLVHYSPTRNERARGPMLIAGDPDDAVWVTVPGGQLFWAQALYVRAALQPTNETHLESGLASRAALIALLYNAPDLAASICVRGALADVAAALR